ncbi:ankyrin [Penicillium atrosanguineum]|nr:ankyrin [Penicillium atrosanguineum]
MDRITGLPLEILFMITSYLENWVSDINALSQTNRYFHRLLNDRIYSIVSGDISNVFDIHWDVKESCYSNTLWEWPSKHGKVDCVRKLLQAGVPINMEFPENYHPFIIAAKHGQIDVIRFFLDSGAIDPRPCDAKWPNSQHICEIALSEAVKEGYEPIVRLLADHGTRLQFDSQPLYIEQPLIDATKHGHTSILQFLLESGCDPVAGDGRRNPGATRQTHTALAVAATHSPECLKLMLKTGVEPGFKSTIGSDITFLQEALDSGNLELVKFHFALGLDFEEPFDAAADNFYSENIHSDIFSEFAETSLSHPELGMLLLERIDVESVFRHEYLVPIGCLMEGASSCGQVTLVERILVADWSFLTRRDTEQTQSWIALLSRGLKRAVKGGFVDIATLLLDHGANPDHEQAIVTTVDHLSPILYAIRQGDSNMVTLLLDRQANPYSNEPNEPFLSAVQAKKARPELMQLLIERKCLSRGLSATDDIILLTAVAGGEEVFEMALQYYQIQLDPDDELHKDMFWRTIRHKDVAIVRKLLAAGFDPNDIPQQVGMDESESVLVQATTPWPDEFSEHGPEEVELLVDLLIEHGVSPLCPEHGSGLPILHYLMYEGMKNHTNVAKLLLKKGACPFTTSINDPFDLWAPNDPLDVDYSLDEDEKSTPKTLLERAAAEHDREMVYVLLEFFEQNTPFYKIKDMVRSAAQAVNPHAPNLPGLERLLWRFYWRKAYPCPQT